MVSMLSFRVGVHSLNCGGDAGNDISTSCSFSVVHMAFHAIDPVGQKLSPCHYKNNFILRIINPFLVTI